jgi:hypothetical protein
MRTRTSGLILLLWGTALVPAAFGQESPPVLEGAALEVPVATAPAEPGDDAPAFPPPLVYRGQDYAPPDPQYPLPLYSTRPADGGLYLGLQFVYYQQTQPISDQIIAFRGFFDADGSISSALGGAGVPGTFIGSHKPALHANDFGQSQYIPGYQMFIGWKLRNGAVIEFDWLHLNKVKYAGGASIEPFLFQGGANLADTFLTAPVFNFPNEFAGAAQKVTVGNPGATFGIWNAAGLMQVQFTQRYDQYDVVGRIPIWQTDNNRCYGICGLRNGFLVEKFTWRTVDIDVTGNQSPANTAIYNNNVTNNYFGPVVGCGDEWRLGDTPLGTFALSADVKGGLMIDFVKEYTKYLLGTQDIGSKLTRRQTTFVPMLQFQPNLCWYPIEGVQFKVGYDIFALFNTAVCPNPVDFNFLGIEPALEHATRVFNGMNAGVCLIF